LIVFLLLHTSYEERTSPEIKAKKNQPSNPTLLWYPNALGATAVLLMEVGSDRKHLKNLIYICCFFALKASGSNVVDLGPNGE